MDVTTGPERWSRVGREACHDVCPRDGVTSRTVGVSVQFEVTGKPLGVRRSGATRSTDDPHYGLRYREASGIPLTHKGRHRRGVGECGPRALQFLPIPSMKDSSLLSVPSDAGRVEKGHPRETGPRGDGTKGRGTTDVEGMGRTMEATVGE